MNHEEIKRSRDRAEDILLRYEELSGLPVGREALTDLLTDLMHFAHDDGFFGVCLERARVHYEEEKP